MPRRLAAMQFWGSCQRTLATSTNNIQGLPAPPTWGPSSPCIPACFATVLPFTSRPAIMAAWRDEKTHVTWVDIVPSASRCSLPFQTQLTCREGRHGAAWATRVNTITQNRSCVLSAFLGGLIPTKDVWQRTCNFGHSVVHFLLQWCRILKLYFRLQITTH